MNGRRKPRLTRWPAIVPSRLASALSPAERSEATAAALDGFRALREGVAKEVSWAFVVSAMNMADGFELRVRQSGARGHIQAAQIALDEAMRRAMATGTWCPPTLFLQEIDDIRVGLEIYQVRLRGCTYGEYRRVLDYARAEVLSTGGVELRVDQVQQPLLEAA